MYKSKSCVNDVCKHAYIYLAFKEVQIQYRTYKTMSFREQSQAVCFSTSLFPTMEAICHNLATEAQHRHCRSSEITLGFIA